VIPDDVLVYVSRNNPGVELLVQDLVEYFELEPHDRRTCLGSPLAEQTGEAGNVDKGATCRRPDSVRRNSTGLVRRKLKSFDRFVSNPEALQCRNAEDAPTQVTHMLLYLNSQTFSGELSVALLDEINAAREAGVEVVLAHERDPDRSGCDFDEFFQLTPQSLITSGLYTKVAIECLTGPEKVVSIALLAKACGAVVVTSYALQQRSAKRLVRCAVATTGDMAEAGRNLGEAGRNLGQPRQDAMGTEPVRSRRRSKRGAFALRRSVPSGANGSSWRLGVEQAVTMPVAGVQPGESKEKDAQRHSKPRCCQIDADVAVVSTSSTIMVTPTMISPISSRSPSAVKLMEVETIQQVAG